MSRFCHRRYVSRLVCAQQYQTSDPWMCLFVYTEGSAQHEHQLTGKQQINMHDNCFFDS